jgi:serine phosphatase RsbU (regulator of sigma subunit)
LKTFFHIKNKTENFIPFLLFLLFPVFLFSQKPGGTPFIKNYPPNEYGASPENWAIAQNKKGVIYFGNASGVLEFDGYNWNEIAVLNNSVVRSLAIDDNGIIYVGAVGEFGFLSPDPRGVLIYHSLIDKLPKEEREFADVWKTYSTPDGVFFQTFDKLIRVANNSVKIWKPESSFHFSYYLNKELFIIDREKGLKHLVNDELVLNPGSAILSGLRIYGMLPFSENEILVATREKGLFKLNTNPSKKDSVISLFSAEVNSNLINDQVYSAISLQNNRFAFGTLKNGVFIINSFGEIIQQLNKQNGLQDDVVKNIGLDNQNNMWIALGKGISRAETSSPLEFLNDAQGLKGSIESIEKNGSLYVATSLGVFKSYANNFEKVGGITSQARSFLKFVAEKDTVLLVATEAGIYEIEKKSAKLIQEGFGYFLYRSKINPERIFIGMSDGLASICYTNGNWINEDYFKGIDKEIRAIAEDEKGNLWLGTRFEGLLKINFLQDKKNNTDSFFTFWKKPYEFIYYDTANGLPTIKYNIPYNLNNEIIFATETGFYEFNSKSNTFLALPLLGKEFQRHQIFRLVPNDSLIWLSTVVENTKETGIAYLHSDNTYSWYTKPFGKISESEIHAIYPDENGITWLGGPDGLLRYDAKVKKDFSQPFYALIRKVQVGKDTIFGGNFYEKKDSLNIPVTEQPDFLKPSLEYFQSSMLFCYSATNFEDEQKNLFSFYLEGFDKDWSDWSTKFEKEYTNLKEGNYIFRVKAKNIYGTISIESTYAFKILPPWYRTVWAYITYIVLFIGFVYLIIRLSIRRLVKAKEKLEETVKERTAEVVSQKHLIEEKHKEITDSINYAERIQRSFLATKEVLDENLKEYFVFFQPKDVVSGDFYWASKLKNNQFALVTADSTGHGVPGAIMSLLNITSIEKAVERYSNPAQILTQARKTIIERLKKDGSAEGGKDGMDCSLISFDFENNKLTYSAANNPVWIVRNVISSEVEKNTKGLDYARPDSERTLVELDPDKMPVGKHDRDSVPFSQNTIDLQKGDVVYALTDGMPDQFGGPKGKKFMYKRLKEFLVSIAHLPMSEQKEQIKTSLNDWKGELEQVDDVCLIGVRI